MDSPISKPVESMLSHTPINLMVVRYVPTIEPLFNSSFLLRGLLLSLLDKGTVGQQAAVNTSAIPEIGWGRGFGMSVNVRSGGLGSVLSGAKEGCPFSEALRYRMPNPFGCIFVKPNIDITLLSPPHGYDPLGKLSFFVHINSLAIHYSAHFCRVYLRPGIFITVALAALK